MAFDIDFKTKSGFDIDLGLIDTTTGRRLNVQVRSVSSTRTVISITRSLASTRDLYGVVAGSTIEDLAFTSITNLTESPTYTWTRTAAGNSSASATKSLAASTNGYLQYEINSTESWNAGIGFSSNAGWVTGDPFSYLFYLDGGTGTYKTYDATDGYVDTAIAAVTGDLVKIERSGSTLTAQYYRGGSWTTAHTYTPTSSARQYIYIQIYDVGGTQRVINPKGYNVS